MALTKGIPRINITEVQYDAAGKVIGLLGRWNAPVEDNGVVLTHVGGVVDILAPLTATQRTSVLAAYEKANTTLTV